MSEGALTSVAGQCANVKPMTTYDNATVLQTTFLLLLVPESPETPGNAVMPA